MLFRRFAVVFFFFSVFSFLFSQAQNPPVDSLLALLKNDKEDTTKVNHLDELGLAYKNLGNYDTALYYNSIALRLSQKLNFQIGIANAYGAMGNAYNLKGDYPKSLDYYFKALHIDEELKNKNGMARRLGNIGLIYYNRGDYDRSLNYTFKALKLDTELQNKKGIARHLSNLGNIYYARQHYREALDYYFKALKMDEKLRRKGGIQTNLGNIGVIYKEQGNYSLALEYFLKALKIGQELDDKNAIATWLDNIGSLYTLTNKYEQAEKYLLNSYSLSDSIGDLYGLMGTNFNFSELYGKMGKPGKALGHYKAYTMMKDSIFNAEKDKDMTRKEMNYEFDKKQAAARAEQDKKDAVATVEAGRKNMIIGFSVVVLFVVLIFSGFIFRSLRVTRKQRNLIEEQKIIVEQQKQSVEHQKHIVEEKQKEIIDSITYAKRLQEAILPPLDLVTKHLPDSFVLYKPKDIVAGDFYWMEQLAPGILFIAAADCTGHGVPGAMVSVVCSNALNRAVKEFALRDTGKILDKVTELVVETFAKSDENVKDGMDISLLCIDKTNNKVSWSGANNPIYYVQNDEMIKIASDKQPIGKSDNHVSFTSHTIPLQSNTVFYLFTDGYADQFGGANGKKLMSRTFRELLLANSNLAMPDQKKTLDATIEKWKGNREQVDDILIIGLRV